MENPRKKRRGNKKSRIFKGKPKPREKVPPPDHLFKLPAEVRNQIYGYVLEPEMRCRTEVIGPKKKGASRHGTVKIYTQIPKEIESGDDDEPALLQVFPQIRGEALGIYYYLNIFEIKVNVKQLGSLEKWMSSVRARFEPKESSAFGGITIDLRGLKWSQLPSLLSLARIYQVHHKYLQGYGYWYDEDRCFRLRGLRLGRVLEEVVKLGLGAGEEDWHEEWLSLMFEEWLEKKFDSATVRRHVGFEVGLPGDWHGADEPEANDFDVATFSRSSEHRAGTSDRKLRSQN